MIEIEEQTHHHALTRVFEDYDIAVLVDHDGRPWWLAAQVCDALGIQNATMAVRRLDAEDHKTLYMDTLNTPEGIPWRRNPLAIAISEPGLYELIRGSRKPAARRFNKWLHTEVIPSIRKTGSYSVPGANTGLDLNNPHALRAALLSYTDTVIQLQAEVTSLGAEVNSLRDEQEAHTRTIEAQAPKVEFFDAFMNAEGTITLRDCAKLLGCRPLAFNDALRQRGILTKATLPSAAAVANGYLLQRPAESQHSAWSGMTTRVTRAGYFYFGKLLRAGKLSLCTDDHVTAELMKL